jgi:outer membrane biosynthesis protein TonB
MPVPEVRGEDPADRDLGEDGRVKCPLIAMIVVGLAGCGGGAAAPVAEPAQPEPEPEPEPGRAAAATAEAAPAAVTRADDASQVRQVIKANLGAITACYQDVARKAPGIEGTVTATFTIAADGSVADADAVGVHGAVDACIIHLLRTLHFPPPNQAPLVIKYPFVFRPLDAGGGAP